MELFAHTVFWIPVVLFTIYSSGAVESFGGSQGSGADAAPPPPLAVFMLLP